MSPRINSGSVEWSATTQPTACSEIAQSVNDESFPAAAKPAATAAVPGPSLTTSPPAEASVRSSSPPLVRRRSALKIAASPTSGASPALVNKWRTPRSMSVNARSSSVVASKGMLFSRSELRPAPSSSVSAKYGSNVNSGFLSSSCWSSSPSEMSGDSKSTEGAPSRGGGELSSTGTLLPAEEVQILKRGSQTVEKKSENLATLRIIEARRRAAWSFVEPSSPPRLAALGSSRTNCPLGSTSPTCRRRRCTGRDITAATKTQMPPLPKIPKMGTTIPTSSPLHLPNNMNNTPKLLISTTTSPDGLGAPEAPTPKPTAPPPLSEPVGSENARTLETLEQKWAAWQGEHRGPTPLLGKPAPAPPVACASGRGRGRGVGRGSIGRRGGASWRRWGGGRDFHEKVAFLGDYVSSVFGRAMRVSVTPDVCEVQCEVD